MTNAYYCKPKQLNYKPLPESIQVEADNNAIGYLVTRFFIWVACANG